MQLWQDIPQDNMNLCIYILMVALESYIWMVAVVYVTVCTWTFGPASILKLIMHLWFFSQTSRFKGGRSQQIFFYPRKRDCRSNSAKILRLIGNIQIWLSWLRCQKWKMLFCKSNFPGKKATSDKVLQMKTSFIVSQKLICVFLLWKFFFL